MKLLPSLRARVLLGAFIWSVGLFAAGTITVTLSRWAQLHLQRVHSYMHTAAFIGIVAMVIGFIFVSGALLPFSDLRRRLVDVRKGVDRRLRGDYPSEVQPLVDDLNGLLEHREEAIRRAIAKAGDLAHGLKTPLAVLAQEADRVARAGDRATADAISQQVDRMRRQIDYHLAHARASAAGAASGARTAIAVSADGLARTLERLHADRGIAIGLDIAAGHIVRAQREDLDEMLGNLLDNACKWARTQVRVSSAAAEGAIAIDVEDDGPGLDPSMREAVMQRGVRADEAAAGSGLGLAIVRDIAEVYGGSITLDGSPLGGLRARLVLPA